MKKILVAIHGSYFSSNFGDTLLIKKLCDETASIVGAENVYLARSPNGSDKVEIPYKTLPRQLNEDVTHLLFAGGGYFGEPPGSYLTKSLWAIRNYYRHLSWIRSLSSSKIGLFGVGVGPITSGFYLKATRNLFDKASLKLVRDQESFDFCETNNFQSRFLKISVDFALDPSVRKLERLNTIGIHAPSGNLSFVEDIVSIICDIAGDKETKFVILSDNKNENKKCINLYNSSLKITQCRRNINMTFTPYETCKQFEHSLSTLGTLITTKLHAGIVTISQGGFVISIPSHHKTKRLYSQLGISKYCIPIEDFNRNAFISALIDRDGFKPNYALVSENIANMRKALIEYLN